MKAPQFLFLSTFCLLLSACGGGGSSGSDNSQNDDTTNTNVDNNTNNPIDNNDSNTDSNIGGSSLGVEVEYVDRMHISRTTPSSFDLGNSQLPKQNTEAAIPSMCYTKHEGRYNPCYVCHQDRIVGEGRANRMHDGYLQNEYAFSDYAFTNRWQNLFEDRSLEASKYSDDDIQTYVNRENYTALKPLLESNGFIGYIPDITDLHLGASAFDEDGFAKDGSGWVAFNYKPLPSTFWPSNGSTDDVMIRLHKDFRQNTAGEWSRTVYQFNLAILEMTLKNQLNTTVNNLDENIVGVDLNGDSQLTIVNEIQRPSHYVGKAANIPIETFLYPRYTEFLHSVRYVGVDEQGTIFNAPRLKELRYMVKAKSYHDELVPYTKPTLAKFYDDEFQEKIEGNNPPRFNDLGEKGIDNKMGWWLQAFIENSNGDLRPQTHEETFFCMGCHTNLGSTYDQTFAFARKVSGKDGWGYINLQGMKDAPNVGETAGEILTYLQRVGGGSEFRAKNDVFNRYFDNGVLNEEKVKAAEDVYALITPSKASALKMNKAYRVLVERQSFISGRDGNEGIPDNVYSHVDDTTPTLPRDMRFRWNMQLDWSK